MSTPPTLNGAICGVILAGGKATRMGNQPKGLLKLGDQLLLERVIEKALPQVNHLLLNSNETLPAYENTGLPILADSLPGHLGPLAGILTAMEWCQKHHPETQWLASFAVDTPFFPDNLVGQLLQRAQQEDEQNAEIICSTYDGRRQPTFCLWRISQADDLRIALSEQQLYRVGGWLAQRTTCELAFDTVASTAIPTPFFNINTPADLAQAQTLLETM